ncbi:PP2C family protein-serine/threonine phosphatase [Deinococcus malanensis]|uniref:PP2C family protein-serine/threonine phosphatase n=1 Tax=Deinococcus malanensis TaxID=1706855 RepID=UPI001666DB3F|nr:PP2C family serine/threonine-protein phosphatase [Deinococcus malanensis]
MLRRLLQHDPTLRPTPHQLRAELCAFLRPPAPRYSIGVATTVGLNPERPLNEDAYAYSHQDATFHEAAGVRLVACVADGIGGLEAGDEASGAATRSFVESTSEQAEERFWQANAAVHTALGSRPGGCTFTGVVINGTTVQLVHVGDTRAYRVTPRGCEQLTPDHSLVELLIRQGALTAEHAAHHPQRNAILRSLGGVTERTPEYCFTSEFKLAPGECLVLMSDGVWGGIPAQHLWRIMTEAQDAIAMADALIAAALSSGGADNATALIVHCG